MGDVPRPFWSCSVWRRKWGTRGMRPGARRLGLSSGRKSDALPAGLLRGGEDWLKELDCSRGVVVCGFYCWSFETNRRFYLLFSFHDCRRCCFDGYACRRLVSCCLGDTRGDFSLQVSLRLGSLDRVLDLLGDIVLGAQLHCLQMPCVNRRVST
ncbi:hypothetical protein BDY21DRAFT_332110 [Lineolata rhizophorae]|uniref:Uncharacterized protein n=1 Tax=Lineolata rhizophorae TaxID=578093 RepID=A0A6A6PC57_9PEZI|nr:hypothetical protein BDY21DRAFT_332110 [Lineolata rhizophorae]